MKKVRICIDLDEEKYRAYEVEAKLRGVSVETLVEQVVHGLLHEMEQEEREGTDHPVILP